MSNLVSLEYIDNYDIEKVQTALKKSFNDLKLINCFKPRTKALIKVCMPYSAMPDDAITVNPTVVRAVVDTLTKMGVVCVVADSPYGKFSKESLEEIYLNTGMLEVANTTKCELNLNLKTKQVETPNGLMAKSLKVLEVAEKCDIIINIGKIKIDETFGLVGACSNMFGIIPGEEKTLILNRLNTLKDYNNYLLDIINTYQDKLVLNVLDGVVTLEAGNTQRMLSLLAVGQNVFSVDACVADILKIAYDKTILKQAGEREMFDENRPYKLVSEKIDRFEVKDYAISDFNEHKKIEQNEKAKQKFFKQNQKRVFISEKKCKGCAVCSKICPTGAISMKFDKNGEWYASIDYKKCIFCYKCHTACPYRVVDIIEPSKHKKLQKELNKYNEE